MSKTKSQKRSKSAKADLLLPVSRVQKRMKATMGKGGRVGETSPVYMTAALEYVAAEIINEAKEFAKKAKRKRITPADIVAGIRNDVDLSRAFADVEIVVGEELKDVLAAMKYE